MKKLRKHATMAFLLVAMATIAPVHANSSSIKDQAKEVEVLGEPDKTEMLWIYAEFAFGFCVIVAWALSKPGGDRDKA
jgi:hypothetical protein